MPARSVCLVTLSLSEAGPGRFGRQVSVTGIYHTIPYQRREVSVLTCGSAGLAPLLRLAVTITTTVGLISKGLPTLLRNLPGGWFIADDPFFLHRRNVRRSYLSNLAP